MIEKVNSRVVIASVTQAVIEDVLHESDEAETLVRTIVDFHVDGLLDPLAVLAWNIQVAPKGTIINTPGVAEALDVAQRNTDILDGNVQQRLGLMNVTHSHIKIDSSGMRKLKRGDQIVLQTSSSPTQSFAITGNVKMFFKE